MDAVIKVDTGGSEYIANLARKGRELERELATLRADVKPLFEAARCIRHWHDTEPDGMVVSREKVFLLWDALKEFAIKHPEHDAT